MGMETLILSAVPLRVLIRRRRTELGLSQSNLAAALRVTPECITSWENGRRRMELGKVPRLATVLQLDPKDLCVKALAEFYPVIHATLFVETKTSRTNAR